MYIGSSPAEQVATTASFLPSISKQVTPTIKDYVGESPSIIYGSQTRYMYTLQPGYLLLPAAHATCQSWREYVHMQINQYFSTSLRFAPTA